VVRKSRKEDEELAREEQRRRRRKTTTRADFRRRNEGGEKTVAPMRREREEASERVLFGRAYRILFPSFRKNPKWVLRGRRCGTARAVPIAAALRPGTPGRPIAGRPLTRPLRRRRRSDRATDTASTPALDPCGRGAFRRHTLAPTHSRARTHTRGHPRLNGVFTSAIQTVLQIYLLSSWSNPLYRMPV